MAFFAQNLHIGRVAQKVTLNQINDVVQLGVVQVVAFNGNLATLGFALLCPALHAGVTVTAHHKTSLPRS
jgi:hypothetical protein